MSATAVTTTTATMTADEEKKNDERWCELGEDRYGEYGVIGAEQADETHYDDRLKEEDFDDADEDDFGADGRIHFAKDKLYGRDYELKQCKELFQANDTAAVFLSGYSGSGKSRIVDEFVIRNSTIRNRKPSIIFLKSKSEAMRESVPFSSISGIFDNIDKSVSDEFIDMRDQIQTTLGADAKLLLKVFPKLERYIGKETDPASSFRSSWSSNSGSLAGSNSGSLAGSQSVASSSILGSSKKQATKKRMMSALQVFFRMLSKSKRRLCIFLDDLQWLDAQSMELIETILTDNTIKNLFFFGGYRSNEVGDDHVLMKRLEIIKETRNENAMKEILCIELKELDKEAIGQFIADSLRLEFDETLPLTNAVFTKTLGNPFFTRQALEYLVLKNALYYDTISFRWDWKLKESELKELISDDLLEMIKVKFEQLNPKLQEVLMTASCTRSTFDVDTILVLLNPTFLTQSRALFGVKASEQQMKEERGRLMELLNQAVVEGLLVQPQAIKRASNLRYSIKAAKTGDALGDEFAFAHDKIQETAMALISSGGNRIEFLERIGNLLSHRAQCPIYGEDWMFFAACEHLNRVSAYHKTQQESEKQEKKPNVMDQGKQQRLATLNLRTAELSMQLLAFPTALEFCGHGIAHLPVDEEERWSEKYRDITLNLYSIAAQANYGVADVEEAERYCNLVISQTSGPNQKVSTMEAIRVFLIYLDVIGDKGEKETALQLCLEMLKEFGISVPRNERMLKGKVWLSLKQIKSKYMPTEESIQSMPEVMDPIIIYKMELMSKAASLAFSSDQTCLYMLLCCESVKLITEHGLTESSATSIASFANVLMHVHGDFKTSPKLADLAILIANRQQSKFGETRPLNTSNHNVLGWVRPISSCLKYHERAYKSGIESGNLNGAALGKWFLLQSKLFSCSVTLPELEEDFRDGVLEMRKNGQVFVSSVAAAVWQLTLNFIGKSGNSNSTVLSGEAIDEDTKQQMVKVPHLFGPWESFALLFFGDFEGGAEDALKRGDEFHKAAVGMMFGFESVMRAIPLLVMARLDSSNKAKYRKPAIKLLQRVRRWVKKGCINLIGPLQLMEAEFAALQRKESAARSHFEMAIESCRKDGFHHFAGLSCELYSAYLSEVGDSQGEKIYLQGAIDDYRRWGAARKVEMLKTKLSR